SLTFTYDNKAPTLSSIGLTGTAAAQGGHIGLGQTLSFTLNFSEAVKNTTSAPQLFLSDGETANFNAGASDLADGKAAFSLVVSAGHSASNLTVSGFGGFGFSDIAGNAFSQISVIGASIGTGVDTTAPTIASFSTNPSHAGMAAILNEKIEIDLLS